MARTAVNVTGDLTACVLVDQADSGDVVGVTVLRVERRGKVKRSGPLEVR